MILRGNYLYEYCETGELIKVGKIIEGLECDYIRWYN